MVLNSASHQIGLLANITVPEFRRSSAELIDEMPKLWVL